MANIVAIVGRPNVGKSTFFNRLIGERKAIMDNQSGVTRDRHYGFADWIGHNFTVIDTGGYVTNSEDIFEAAIREQVNLALEEATVILFMVDVETGLTDLDKEFANVLRKSKKPIYIVANKADNALKSAQEYEFYALGFDKVFAVSSQSGSGTGDLLDAVVTHFPDQGIEDPEAGIPKVCVLGRPNVGKSSLVNVLLGRDRSIVTDIAGTTRDSINSRYKLFDKEFILVDTAGIRKKKKVHEDIEFYSVMRAIQALEQSDICLLVVDATQGLETQDLNILNLSRKHHKGIIILVNKWDLVEKSTNTMRDFEQSILERVAPDTYIPMVFISVLEKQRIHKVIETISEVYENMQKKIPTSQLNDKLLPEIERYPPPAWKGKYVKIKYVTQLPTNSRTFAFYCNLPKYIREPYYRFIENKIRTHFDFTGVPINILFKDK